jgi:lipopolysaccharide/colanic/teichoic acid biosynthesis glycosyltransferase
MPTTLTQTPAVTPNPAARHLAATSGARHFRQALFITTDLACVTSSAFLAIALRFPETPSLHSHRAITEHTGISLLYAALIVLFCHTQNLYTAYQTSTWTSELATILKSILYATVLLGSTLFITNVKTTSRLIVAATAIAAALTMTAWRQLLRRSLKRAKADGLSCHNVLIAGTNPLAQSLAQHLTHHPHFGLVLIGHLETMEDDETMRRGHSGRASEIPQPSETAGVSPLHHAPSPLPGAPTPLPTLGPATNLRQIARTHFIDELIICTHHRPTILHLLQEARMAGIGVRLIPDLYNAPNPRLDYLGDFPSLTLLHRHTPAIAITTKRLLDTWASLFALLFLAPVFLVIAAIIKLDSKGPVFYASQRIGKKGHTFPCLKFRTMVADADARKAALQHLNERDGILFKITRDPRITRAGAFLRKHSLDELPQLWNVLKGDMSLVGPRPPLASEVKNYQLDHLRRLDVAPGITGLWQVEARNNPSFDRYIELDLKYVENWTLGLDLDILIRTVGVVLAGTGS